MNTEDTEISNKNKAHEILQAEIAEEREMLIECEHIQSKWTWKLLLNEKNVAYDRNLKKEKRTTKTAEERKLLLNIKKKTSMETTKKCNERNCEYLNSETDKHIE
ncbi:22477_t:CDS:2, partial [Gigaspora rosea]